MRLNGTPLMAGDGAAVADERTLELVGEPAPPGRASEVLLFDLA